MGLKPYWKKHPVQLRISAGICLLLSPLLLLWAVLDAAWEDRSGIARMYREIWRYMVKGGEEL